MFRDYLVFDFVHCLQRWLNLV